MYQSRRTSPTLSAIFLIEQLGPKFTGCREEARLPIPTIFENKAGMLKNREGRLDQGLQHPSQPALSSVETTFCGSISSCGSRGPGGLSPPCPQDFFKIIQFSGNFKEKKPYFEQMLGSGPPLGSKLRWGAPDQNPGSAPDIIDLLVCRISSDDCEKVNKRRIQDPLLELWNRARTFDWRSHRLLETLTTRICAPDSWVKSKSLWRIFSIERCVKGEGTRMVQIPVVLVFLWCSGLKLYVKQTPASVLFVLKSSLISQSEPSQVQLQWTKNKWPSAERLNREVIKLTPCKQDEKILSEIDRLIQWCFPAKG